MKSTTTAKFAAIATLISLSLIPASASAFWLLGFSSADTLPPGALGAIAGTGAQYSTVGQPSQQSFTAFIPHAGVRVGITDNLDLGYRLTQVALPFSSVGPTLGSEIDAKYLLTPPNSTWQVAAVGGIAYAYLDISNQSKNAWSPGADLIASRVLSPTYTLFSELRYVYTAIPSALGGAADNYVNAAGIGIGTKIKLTPQTSLVPEIGVFNLNGKLLGASANGVALQIGAVLSMRIW